MSAFKAPAAALILAALAAPAVAQDNPLAKYLAVPGAMTTLPVEATKSPWTLEFARQAQGAFENFHYQMGGDHALYYNQNLAEFLPTAYASPHPDYMPLERAIDASLGEVRWTTAEGEMALSDYLVHPNHRVQGMMMIHLSRRRIAR